MAHSFKFVSILFVMYSFCNNKIDKENVYVWASLYIQKKLKHVGVGFFFFFFGFFGSFFFAFMNMPEKKLHLLMLLWSSYPLTLATFFLVDLHNKRPRNLSPTYNYTHLGFFVWVVGFFF